MLARSVTFEGRSATVVLAICLLAIWTGFPLHGQGFGKIVGAVTDPQGLGVPGARITVTEAPTRLETRTTTSQDGLYTVPALRPTEYNLTVTAGGFRTFTQSGITLRADEAVTVNATLQVGQAIDKIAVTADAVQVDTATSTLGQVVDSRRLADLPMNGRNAAQLTVLVGGAIAAPNDSADQGQTKTFPVVVTVSANGSRANTTNYMLDGGNNVDEYTNVNLPFPFPDALQEFSVETSNYSAQYGQNAGGVVNVVTKSGTNELHGDAFEYVRNREFNARNFFAQTVDPLKRNQFGATVGAPIIIPGLYKGRDKTFFFFGYQGTILREMLGAQSAYAEISRMDIDSQYQEPGAFTFTADTTNSAPASFLLGYLRTLTQGSGQFFNNRNQFLGLYATDSYRVSKRLTLNYGLRWEPFFPWKELKHRMEQFNPAAYNANQISTVYTNAPKGLLFPGDPGVPENGVNANYRDFEPRVGFAWDVTGDGKTSLRSGAGMFYDSRMMAGFMNAVTTNTPFSPTVSITTPQGPFSNPYFGITNPFPEPVPVPKTAAFPLPVVVVTFDPSGNYKVPVTYNWNLTVERQLAKDWMAHVSYVGSHSSHVATSLQLNPAVYTPGSTLSTDQRRIFQSFSGITVDSQAVNGDYGSLQAGFEKRLSRGFTILTNYTFSKSLDNLPYGQSVTGPGPNASGTVYPWYFPKADALDYGRSDFDRRQRFVISYVWQLPTLRSAGKLVRAVFGD